MSILSNVPPSIDASSYICIVKLRARAIKIINPFSFLYYLFHPSGATPRTFSPGYRKFSGATHHQCQIGDNIFLYSYQTVILAYIREHATCNREKRVKFFPPAPPPPPPPGFPSTFLDVRRVRFSKHQRTKNRFRPNIKQK